MTHRRQLLEKNLLYLFSLDTNLENGREDIGFVPGGVRINIHATRRDSRVFNVTGDTRLLGEKTLAGTVEWGSDQAFARVDDREVLDLRLLILTDDGAVVESEFSGILATGPRSYRQLVSEKPRYGSEQNPMEAPVYVEPRFHSSNADYAWLNGRQCLGIGKVRLIDSVARQSTLDFWMLD